MKCNNVPFLKVRRKCLVDLISTIKPSDRTNQAKLPVYSPISLGYICEIKRTQYASYICTYITTNAIFVKGKYFIAGIMPPCMYIEFSS